MYKLPKTSMSQRHQHKEKKMLAVTDKASEVIKDFLKDKDANAAIRITMSFG